MGGSNHVGSTPAYVEKRARAEQRGMVICVGMDDLPEIETCCGNPECRKQAITQWLVAMGKAAAPYAAAYKFSFATYMTDLDILIEVIHQLRAYTRGLYGIGTPMILDSKFGDIKNTMVKYARQTYMCIGADAVTLNPYLGIDELEPFLQRQDRGAFVLCKTSNPKGEFQDIMSHGGKGMVWEKVAESLACHPLWHSGVGMVFGATHPSQIAQVRQRGNKLPMLIPGIGAQGGDLEKTIAAAMLDNGTGYIINVSRGLFQDTLKLEIDEAVKIMTQRAKEFHGRIIEAQEKVLAERKDLQQ